jgi:hypothetical protein
VFVAQVTQNHWTPFAQTSVEKPMVLLAQKLQQQSPRFGGPMFSGGKSKMLKVARRTCLTTQWFLYVFGHTQESGPGQVRQQ